MNTISNNEPILLSSASALVAKPDKSPPEAPAADTTITCVTNPPVNQGLIYLRLQQRSPARPTQESWTADYDGALRARYLYVWRQTGTAALPRLSTGRAGHDTPRQTANRHEAWRAR